MIGGRKRLQGIFMLTLIFFSYALFDQAAVIDVSWDTFNKNQYDGMLLLPPENGGTPEFVGGFGKSVSRDGTVVSGESGASGITSLNAMHWEIKRFKSGFYRFYLFCKGGSSNIRDDWSSDVRITVKAGDKVTVITPSKRKGEVWSAFVINGDTGRINTDQVFFL